MRIGDRVRSRDTRLPGTVRYVGEITGQKGEWVGVEWDYAVGNYDGSYKGRRYFSCTDRHGAFLRERKLISCTELLAQLRQKYVTDRQVDGLDAMSVTDGYLDTKVQFYGKRKIDVRQGKLEELTEMGLAETDVAFVADYATVAAAAPSCHTLDLSFTAVGDPFLPLELLCAMPNLRVIALTGCAIPWASLTRGRVSSTGRTFSDVCERLSARPPFTLINDNSPLHRGHDTCWGTEDFRVLLSLPGLSGLQFDYATLDLYRCLRANASLTSLQASYSFSGVNIVELISQLASHLTGLRELTLLADGEDEGCHDGTEQGMRHSDDVSGERPAEVPGAGQPPPRAPQNSLAPFDSSFRSSFAEKLRNPSWREEYSALISSAPRRTFQHLDELDTGGAGEEMDLSETTLGGATSTTNLSSTLPSGTSQLPPAALADLKVPDFHAGGNNESGVTTVGQNRALRCLNIGNWNFSRNVLRFLRICLPCLEKLRLGPVGKDIREFAIATLGGTLTRFASRPLDPLVVEDSRRHLVSLWMHACASKSDAEILPFWLDHFEEQVFLRQGDVPLPARVSAALLEREAEVNTAMGYEFKARFSHILSSNEENQSLDETERLYSGRMVRLFLEKENGGERISILVPRSTEIWRLVALSRTRYSVDVSEYTLISRGRAYGEKISSFGRYLSIGDVLGGCEGLLSRR